MKVIKIGLVGSGFSAHLHAEAYKRVYGIQAQIAAVASVDNGVKGFAEAYHIPQIYNDYKEMMEKEQLDVIDICTPPVLHMGMIKTVLKAGLHVICEKPITGCFNPALTKGEMLKQVMEEMEMLKADVNTSPGKFMYAENYIYAPVIKKTVEFLEARRSKILFIRGEESHSGSHAGHAAHWCYNGGGALIRQGTHPLCAALYLKYKEASIRGEDVGVVQVMGDMGITQACLSEQEKRHIYSRPEDVEDLANVVLTFSDGTKASIISGDMVLCGVRNIMEIFTNDGAYFDNIAPNNHLAVYHPDEENLDSVYITEKVGNKSGWQPVFVDEIMSRGYVGEMQDFMESIVYDRTPQSDFRLAYDCAKIVYAAYQSAEEGRRIFL